MLGLKRKDWNPELQQAFEKTKTALNIRHISGEHNYFTDALSRAPPAEDQEENVGGFYGNNKQVNAVLSTHIIDYAKTKPNRKTCKTTAQTLIRT